MRGKPRALTMSSVTPDHSIGTSVGDNLNNLEKRASNLGLLWRFCSHSSAGRTSEVPCSFRSSALNQLLDFNPRSPPNKQPGSCSSLAADVLTKRTDVHISTPRFIDDGDSWGVTESHRNAARLGVNLSCASQGQASRIVLACLRTDDCSCLVVKGALGQQ